MRMCEPHWRQLRTAVYARGLRPLVAGGSKELLRRVELERKKGPSIDTFDPLMTAHNMIMWNALNIAGPAVLVGSSEAEKCPICVLSVPEWIEKSADEVLRTTKTTYEAA